MSHNGGKSRDELAREANQVRTKLLRTVEQLDHRRHEVGDVRLQLQRHVRQLVAVGALTLLATAGAVVLIVQRAASAAERRRRDRWRLLRTAWRHPDRAMRGERRSFFGKLARSVLLSVLSAAVTIPARRAIALLVEARPPHDAARARADAR